MAFGTYCRRSQPASIASSGKGGTAQKFDTLLEEREVVEDAAGGSWLFFVTGIAWLVQLDAATTATQPRATLAATTRSSP
jgi:hypothetical protein